MGGVLQRVRDAWHLAVSQSSTQHCRWCQCVLSSATSNDQLVHNLCCNGIVHSPRVREVLSAIDRACFVPLPFPPYEDSAQPLGFQSQISAPHVHASALELLCDYVPPQDALILDIGCGSGFMSACLSAMAGDTGRVLGVEHVAELADMARQNIAECGPAAVHLRSDTLRVIHGDGLKGVPVEALQGWESEATRVSCEKEKGEESAGKKEREQEEDEEKKKGEKEHQKEQEKVEKKGGDREVVVPQDSSSTFMFDVIHCGASCRYADIPRYMLDTLRPNGALVIPLEVEDNETDQTAQDKNHCQQPPVKQVLCRLTKTADGRVHIEPSRAVWYVPLTSLHSQLSDMESHTHETMSGACEKECVDHDQARPSGHMTQALELECDVDSMYA